MAKKRRIPAVAGPRNTLHNHPLLRKGGIHQPSKKAKRQQDKINLRKEWPDESSQTGLPSGHFFTPVVVACAVRASMFPTEIHDFPLAPRSPHGQPTRPH